MMDVTELVFHVLIACWSVCHVQVMGSPLSPFFEVEIDDASGSLVLKHFPRSKCGTVPVGTAEAKITEMFPGIRLQPDWWIQELAGGGTTILKYTAETCTFFFRWGRLWWWFWWWSLSRKIVHSWIPGSCSWWIVHEVNFLLGSLNYQTMISYIWRMNHSVIRLDA